jgi:hypothetical protein
MRAVLLPAGPMDRTLDVDLDGWTEPGWPERLVLTVLHRGERLVHDGKHYEVTPVVAPTMWRLQLALPGGLGVYVRTQEEDVEAFPVRYHDRLPAASLPKETVRR